MAKKTRKLTSKKTKKVKDLTLKTEKNGKIGVYRGKKKIGAQG